MPLFQRGSRFGGPNNQDRWLVTRKLGEGQFAEVYEVRDTFVKDRELKYAVKIEKRKESKTVKQELKVLKRLNPTCQQVCQVIDTGTFDDRFYIVMELLGENLAEAKRNEQNGCFDATSVQHIGGSILNAIQHMHEVGYIHRDVKPANFAITLGNPAPSTGTWGVIDFGLARRYIGEDGGVLPERMDASFRGSTTYASLHAHKCMDQGRRDDLWSWLYILVELLEGALPWRLDREEQQAREAVEGWKEACLHQPHRLSLRGRLPEPLVEISQHLRSLGFADTPDYAFIRQQLSLLTPHPNAVPTYEPHPAASDAPYAYQAPAHGASPYWGGEQGPSPYNLDTDPAAYPTNRDASDAADVGPSPASPFAHAALPHQRHKRPHEPDPGDGYGEAQRAHRRQRLGKDLMNGAVEGGADGDDSERVKDVMGCVQMFQQGQVSPEAQAVVQQLCRLEPAEGLAALATTMELLVSRTAPAGLPYVASFLSSLSAFSRDASRRAQLRHCTPATSS